MCYEEGEVRRQTNHLARVIRREHLAAWLGAASAFCECKFRRGLVEELTITRTDAVSPRDFRDAVRDLFRREPIVERLIVRRPDSLHVGVLSAPELPFLSGLTLLWGGVESALPTLLGAIVSTPRLARIKRLSVMGGHTTWDDIRPLLDSPALARLVVHHY